MGCNLEPVCGLFLLFFRSFSKIKGNKIEEAKRMEYTLTQEMVKEYERYLRLAERSSGTIQKYLQGYELLTGKPLDK